MATVRDNWRKAAELSDELFQRAMHLASEPRETFSCTLPPPPGANDWWEPYTMQRGARRVASLRLTPTATRYKVRAERLLLERGVDIVGLEDQFRDLWLHIDIISYLATPLERDADGPLKPLQDLFCSFLGVDDARVRRSSALLRLDPDEARVQVCISGYRLWDSTDDGGPFYLLRTRTTDAGPRSEPVVLTPRTATMLLADN